LNQYSQRELAEALPVCFENYAILLRAALVEPEFSHCNERMMLSLFSMSQRGISFHEIHWIRGFILLELICRAL
jgi:hypothetical protein